MRIKMWVAYDTKFDTFAILADKEPSKPWTEEIDTDCNCLADAPEGLTATDYAQLVVDYFNDTLKPGEERRRLVKAEEI